MSRSVISSLFVFILFTIAAFAQGPHHFQPGFNLFSKQQDVQLGQEAAAQVRKQMTVIKDPVLTNYVNAVGKRLANTPEAQQSGFSFTFEVVADPSINAFALPGGPMFINTGLLKAVDNEAQLAGVMGHEMSHVILRHGTNQASKQNLIELPAVLASSAAGGSMAGKLAQLGIGLGANSVLLKFSRSAETQADLTGSHIMAEAGYNPMEMARFFEKLSAQGGAGAPQFMSDHPNPGNRERAIEEEAASLPHRNYGYETGQFQRMKQVVAAIHEPAPKRQSGQ
jgi:beta-barrel assembly-enhancing protease